MKDIQVSVCAPSNRPRLWQWFYDTVSMNTVNFELIFVGDVVPSITLPDNFKFIYSAVKPTQCRHIAVSHAQGETLIFLGDDCHYSPFALDVLYGIYQKENDYKCLSAPKYFGVVDSPASINDIQKLADTIDRGRYVNDPESRLNGDLGSPPCYVGYVISRQFFNELGGFDKRFVFGYDDMDVQLRAHQVGCNAIFNPDVWVAERKDLCPGWNTYNDFSKPYSGPDLALLKSFWVKDGRVNQSRLEPLQPYDDSHDTLTVSVKPSGKWK